MVNFNIKYFNLVLIEILDIKMTYNENNIQTIAPKHIIKLSELFLISFFSLLLLYDWDGGGPSGLVAILLQ